MNLQMNLQAMRIRAFASAVVLVGVVFSLDSVGAQDRSAGMPQEAERFHWSAWIDYTQFPSNDIYAHISIIRLSADQPIVSGIKVRSIYERAFSGEDFADLARVYSECQSAQTGGDLGWVTKGHLVESMDRLAFSMVAGQISEPVLTEFGWMIVKHHGYVIDLRPANWTSVDPMASEPDEPTISEDEEFSWLEALLGLVVLGAIADEEEVEQSMPSQPGVTGWTGYPVTGWGPGNGMDTQDEAYWQRELERLRLQNFQSSISGATVTTSPEGSVSYNQLGGGSAVYIPGHGVSVYTPPVDP